LELVEETGVERVVFWPAVLRIVREHVAGSQVRADHQTGVCGANLEEASRMIVSSYPLGEVGPDAVPVQSSRDFLLERHHHGNRGLADDLTLYTAHDRQPVISR